MLYDSLLIIPLFMAMQAVWVSIWGPVNTIQEQAVPPAVQWSGWIVILTIFFGAFWRRGGQTLGMQAWRVKLITETGQKPTWRQVVVRLVGAVLSAAALGIGYAWRAVPPSRRYWHDTLSGTHLELMPTRE